MKKFLSLLMINCLLFSAFFTAAQESDSIKAKPQFKLSVNYNSNLNYFGRTDSLKSSGVFPLAEFWATPNWYINAAPIFVNNAIQKMEYAGTVATLGYQYMNEDWFTNLYLLKPFYTESSDLVQSALKAQTGVNISRLTNVVNINVGGDVKFSDKMDFGATAGLDHIIRIENKDNSIFVFNPSFYTYAGTQNFTRTYFRKKSDFLLFPGNNERVTENVQKFNVLAYEVSVPVIYGKGKLQVIATPSYVIPQNLMVVPDRPDLSEQGENTFYTTLAVRYSF